MKNLTVALKSVLVAVAAPFVVVACCTGVENPDDQLQVEVEEPVEASTDGPTSENRCDAEVIAHGEDGEEVVLEEDVRENADGSTRCVYVGTVDPAQLYTVEVRREGKIAVDGADSNPACSVATDPRDTDAVLQLRDAADLGTLYRAPPSSPVAGRDIAL